MEAKGSRARIAFALFCGLAVCCSVMYLTSDGADTEVVEASKPAKYVGAGYDLDAKRDGGGAQPRSIESVDVKKAAVIVTNTPDGRMKLKNFLTKIEKLIAKERAGRQHDISAIKQHMEKNFELNQHARDNMKKFLLKKMAENAKIAKDALAKNMREAQAKFAAAGELANKRNNANIARSKKTREIMKKNKEAGAKNLKSAVLAQQKSLAALKAKTNAKIHQTEKNIHANALQIKKNAKAAADALQKAMNRFDHKMSQVKKEAAAGRSKLVAQAAAQDKAFRQMANNKVKALAAETAKQFAEVRKKMAKDRKHADQALAHASSKMSAALNAQKALNDKRFKKTVADIKAAKKEAADRVEKAKTDFKTKLLHLAGTVKNQVSALNRDQNDLAQTVTKNKAEQAKVNRNVDAELKRMQKLGEKRYQEHLKKDKELHGLLAKNKAATKREMDRMASTFMMKIGKIKAQMKKDRAHQEQALKGATDGLFATLKSNAAKQAQTNSAIAANTKKAGEAAAGALEDAKLMFATKLAKLHAVAIASAKKQEAKIHGLTGVVVANAVKDAKGRAQLAKTRDANKKEIEDAIHDAIAQGKARALQVEKRNKDMNKKMKTELLQKVNNDISELRAATQRSLYTLRLQTKEARAEMRKEVEAALSEAKEGAQKRLMKTVTYATGRFASLEAILAKNSKASAAARKKLEAQVATEKAAATQALQNAVDDQSRSLLAFEEEGKFEMKKTNKKLGQHAAKMIANANKVKGQIKSNIAALTGKIAAAKEAAKSGLAAANSASQARYKAALSEVTAQLQAAEKTTQKRFSKTYEKMGQDRAAFEKKVAGEFSELNEALAQQAAIQNRQFTKDLPGKIKDYKEKSMKRVANARKAMATGIVGITAEIKASEGRLLDEINVVSKGLMSFQSQQIKINKEVKQVMGAIVKASNAGNTKSKRFHKEILMKVNQNKAAAAEEVAALSKKTEMEVAIARGSIAAHLRSHKKELTKASKNVYKALATQDEEHAEALAGNKAALAKSKASMAAQLKSAKGTFKAKLTALTNLVTANNDKFKRKIHDITGVVSDWKAASAKDRALLKEEVQAMDTDLRKGIQHAVSMGEAKRAKVESEAMANVEEFKQSALVSISEQVENMADEVFATVQGGRQQIADNYLSLKAYAKASADAVEDYVTKGKGRNLASIGDLLQSVSGVGSLVKKSPGVGGGVKSIPAPFGGKPLKLKTQVSKINFLVDEFMRVFSGVQTRWQMGLGKYLLSRVEKNMMDKGVLEVDHVEGKSGNFVFINGHSVGLSSRLPDFEELAVRMDVYQKILSGLTAKHGIKHHSGGPKKISVPAPEWQGN